MNQKSTPVKEPKYFSSKVSASNRLSIELPDEVQEETKAVPIKDRHPSSARNTLVNVMSAGVTPSYVNGRTPRYRELADRLNRSDMVYKYNPRPPSALKDRVNIQHKRPVGAPRRIFKRRITRLTPKNVDSPIELTTPKSAQLDLKSPIELTTPKSWQLDLKNLVTQVENQSENKQKEHAWHTYQALKFVRELQPIEEEQLNDKKRVLPKRTNFSKLLIFDLDETLAHCWDSKQDSDITLPVTFPSGKVVDARLNIRPYARECLQEARRHFEVAVFTASHQCYADAVLDYLDPNKNLIQHRLYRQSCVVVNGIYIKDLRIITNWNIKNVIIVDNAAYSFGYQLDNGIPIISWHNDPNDRELYNLIDYMKVLQASDDIREVNRRIFKLSTFVDEHRAQFEKNLQ